MDMRARKLFEHARDIVARQQVEAINDSLIKGLILNYDDSDTAFRTIMETIELLGEHEPTRSMFWMWQLHKHGFDYGFGHDEELKLSIKNMLDKVATTSPIRGAMYAALLISESDKGNYYNKMAQNKLLVSIFEIAVNSNNVAKAQLVLKNCLEELRPEQREQINNDAVALLLRIKLRGLGIIAPKL